MRGQDALAANSEQIIQLAPVSIMSIDAEGRITFVNDWHLANFARGKYDRDFYLGRKLQDLPGIVTAGVAGEVHKILAGDALYLEAVYHRGMQRRHSRPTRTSGGFPWSRKAR